MRVEHIPTRHGSLAVRRTATTATPLVCLHGFSLHGGMFAGLGVRLEPVVAPDLPGHGATTVTPVDLETTLAALSEWLEREVRRAGRSTPVDLLGYSQGGRIALHLATRRPDLVARTIVVSAGPGLSGAARERRRTEDATLAERLESIGLEAFLDIWLENPLVRPATDDEHRRRDRALRSENTATGLAAALRGLGQGALPEVDLAALGGPSLWVAGETDARYAALAVDGAAVTGGDAVIVPGSGHNVVADAPQALAEAVRRFRGN